MIYQWFLASVVFSFSGKPNKTPTGLLLVVSAGMISRLSYLYFPGQFGQPISYDTIQHGMNNYNKAKGDQWVGQFMVTVKLILVTLFIVSLALKTSKAIRNLFNAIRYLFVE